MLVGAGASLDTLDEEGFKPMHKACQSGSLETVKLLIELGADRDDIDDNDIVSTLHD